jgi:TrpR-related protein YerC/YecD
MTDQDKWITPQTTALFEAVLALESPQEAEQFFRDLCTLHELGEMATRWQVVRLLAQGIPYRQIADDTGASTATVTRIAQWLRYGTGGYGLMLKRLGVGREDAK